MQRRWRTAVRAGIAAAFRRRRSRGLPRGAAGRPAHADVVPVLADLVAAAGTDRLLAGEQLDQRPATLLHQRATTGWRSRTTATSSCTARRAPAGRAARRSRVHGSPCRATGTWWPTPPTAEAVWSTGTVVAGPTGSCCRTTETSCCTDRTDGRCGRRTRRSRSSPTRWPVDSDRGRAAARLPERCLPLRHAAGRQYRSLRAHRGSLGEPDIRRGHHAQHAERREPGGLHPGPAGRLHQPHRRQRSQPVGHAERRERGVVPARRPSCLVHRHGEHGACRPPRPGLHGHRDHQPRGRADLRRRRKLRRSEQHPGHARPRGHRRDVLPDRAMGRRQSGLRCRHPRPAGTGSGTTR